jgi:ADP-heptose:LPS heptosyltransferase
MAPKAAAFPAGAPALRVALPDPYVYKSALKRALAHGLDAVGGLALAPAPAPVDWSAVKKMAVLRLDHLGDLLHALPALRRLKRALPKARLDLWVGPWGAELAGLFADVDQVKVTPAAWFQRPQRVEWPWGQINGLAKGLAAEDYDAAFELRGDLRHHLALWQASVPVRVGQALTAGNFLLTHPGRWDARLHEQEQSLALLDQAGLPKANQGSRPFLKLPKTAVAEAARVAGQLKLKKGAGPVLVQAACGTQAKRWPQESWAQVIEGLPKGMPVILLGSAGEREEMLSIAKRVKRPVAVAAGMLSLSGLAAFIAPARLLLSVDSGPAHLAAAQDVPVLSLFSGTNRAAQWAPRGSLVQVLQAQGIPCSPCELSECPYDNACMRALEPAFVLQKALAMLKKL